MWCLAFAVLIWCYGAVSGQGVAGHFYLPTSGVVSSSHPEVVLPMVSALIHEAPRFGTVGGNVVERFDHADSRAFSPGMHQGIRHPCDTFSSLQFRRVDGACNNHDTRGQSFQPLARFLDPAFEDGLQAPRASSVLSGDLPLPSPRRVSRVVHPDITATSRLTIFVMQWGQFMDHEMVSTPLPIEDTRGVINCCGPMNSLPLGNESSECFPIIFEGDDPDFEGRCTSFVRSQPVEDEHGNILLPRNNMNVVTSFIDGSTVYGSTEEKLEELRDPNRRYLLRTTKDDFLPDNGLDDCVKRNASDFCLLAGDERVNEQPGLTLLHIVFVRYHNILARSLRRLNPYASDEFIFQQARAIVGAVIQKILYSDWLPIVLGPRTRRKFDLDIGRGRTVHDPRQDPRIFNSFATAVFRFGHTLIPRSLPLSPTRRPLLRELFFKSFEATENLDTLTEGLALALDREDRSQPPDRFFVREVTAHLFENQEGERNGFDLVALNIQRGRDHGLPSYNTFREILGLGRLSSFSDPALGSGGRFLQHVYADVNDIDLFSGGMVEPPFDGGLVGETFSNLMGIQFQRLRFGDRFFFNNERCPFGFTKQQLRLIQQIRLSHVLCLTTKARAIQLDVFRVPQDGNRPVPCKILRKKHPGMYPFLHYPF